ncbi:MAG: hypothetical protein PHY08_12935 [Candidatus Cloacimonetes bacterium]|nr:hypothetical protein [Candidatus Cloacimonadota bacterium]
MKLHQIDRRWIFLLIFLGVSLPLIMPIGFDIEVTKNVQSVYDLVENSQPGDKILLSFDFDPASKPELQPMAVAIINHAMRKNLKIYCVALWPMGVSLADEIYQIQKEKLIYGENFINLGYKAGGLVSIQAMGKNFREVFPKDSNGDNITDFPIMNDVNSLKDFNFAISFSAGTPGIKEWIMVAGDKFRLPIAGGATAVSTPGFLPYINEQKQLYGLIGGLKAAAEYELLVSTPGTATAGMDAQSIAHLIIILFIILSNVSWYFLQNDKKRGVK